MGLGDRGDLPVDERCRRARSLEASALVRMPRRGDLVVGQNLKRPQDDIDEVGLERGAPLPGELPILPSLPRQHRRRHGRRLADRRQLEPRQPLRAADEEH